MTQYTCKKCGWSGEVSGRPRCLACYRKRTTEWRKANPEKVKEQRARYAKKFSTERREQYNAKRRRLRSKERNAINYRKRLEWLLAGDITRQDLIDIYERENQRCFYCNKKVKPRFTPSDPRGYDHVISRDSGGKHTKDNLVLCCRTCNEKKG